ncbi:MAG: hypothetical protein AAF664_22835, partial [Planctomycetota bacterium]
VNSDSVGLMKGLAEIGVDYGEAIELLRDLKAKQYLQCDFVMDPLPLGDRKYHRPNESLSSQGTTDSFRG